MAKVMLVEDDNNLREIYEARLAAEGYEIISAKDGEEALAVAVKEKPDLIISDVMMPRVSGFDMLDILRTTPETKNTHIIMMTALSQAEDKARAEKLGADRYLVKSQVTLEDVVRTAKEILEGETPGGVRAQAAAPTATTATTEPVAVTPAPAATTDATSSPTPTTEPATDTPAAEPAATPPAEPASMAPAADSTSTEPAAVTPSSVTGVTPPTTSDPATSVPVEPATPDPTGSVEPTPAEIPAAPMTTPAPTETPTAETQATPSTNDISNLSTPTQDEEAVVSQQIQEFLDHHSDATPVEETPAAEATATSPAAEVSPETDASSPTELPATPETTPQAPATAPVAEEVPAPTPEPVPEPPMPTPPVPASPAEETAAPEAPAAAPPSQQAPTSDETIENAASEFVQDSGPIEEDVPSGEAPNNASNIGSGSSGNGVGHSKKVIAPLNDMAASTTPDLAALAAKESGAPVPASVAEAVTAATQGSSAQPAGVQTVHPENAPVAGPGEGQHQVGSVIQPGGSTVDPSKIAL